MFVANILYAQSDSVPQCDMHIKKVQHTSETFTLVVTHDIKCEIIMDDNKDHISLVSKIYENKVIDEVIEHNETDKLSRVDKLLSLAKSKLGDSYMPAQAGPDHFDCSGFVYYLFKTNNISIPRTSLNQSKSGKKLTREEIKKGDILFFDTHHRNHVNHSGVYLGDGKFIHSSSGKAYGVTISELDKGFYLDKFRWGVRKIKSDVK